MKIIAAILISLAFGFGMGSIPVVNEHLHWNLWFIIPVSGLLFGMGVASLQFWSCFALNQKISGAWLFLLAIAGLIGYALVDYGIFLSTTIHLNNVQGLPEGDYKLSDLMSFGNYMAWRLGSSTITNRSGTNMFEIGSTGTVLSYVVDLAGALLGTFVTLFFFTETYPYCDRCSLFKNRENKYESIFGYDENVVQNIFTNIIEVMDRRNYQDIVAFFRDLSVQHQDKKGTVRITVDQRFCKRCKEATIIGKVYRKKGREWDEVNKLAFSFTSQPGEHISFII